MHIALRWLHRVHHLEYYRQPFRRPTFDACAVATSCTAPTAVSDGHDIHLVSYLRLLDADAEVPLAGGGGGVWA
jgi:hypothetical protein